MLTTAAAPIDETAYWGTVAQIVPVFALTLVLEARRMAGTWSQRDRVDRVLRPLSTPAAKAGRKSIQGSVAAVSVRKEC